MVFLALFGMVVVGALLIFIAFNTRARFLAWRITDWSNPFSKTTPNEVDEIMLKVVPLILGLFFLGTGLALLTSYLLKPNAFLH